MTAATPAVLVVDDEVDLRTLLSRYLSDQGFDVVVRADGRELADLLKRRHFDVLVLDLMMPASPASPSASACARLGRSFRS